MDISNRSLILLLVVTLVLVGAAGALTIGLTFSKKAEEAAADVPQGPVIPDVVRQGGQKIEPQGPLVVEVDSALQPPPASALLTCDMYKTERPYWEGGMGFENIPFGNCTVLLSGASVAYGPVFPGDRLICGITRVDPQSPAKTSCAGGTAAEMAGTVSVASALPGTLELDGDDLGPLPVVDAKMKVGKRALVVHLTDGRKLDWQLVVQPDERITVSFPDPATARQKGLPPMPPPAAPPVEAPAPAPEEGAATDNVPTEASVGTAAP